MGPGEMREIGELIIDAIEQRGDPPSRDRLAGRVAEICERFPVPGLIRPAPVAGAPAA
jgi:glycine/serine hydroxymethyltransferase